MTCCKFIRLSMGKTAQYEMHHNKLRYNAYWDILQYYA